MILRFRDWEEDALFLMVVVTLLALAIGLSGCTPADLVHAAENWSEQEMADAEIDHAAIVVAQSNGILHRESPIPSKSSAAAANPEPCTAPNQDIDLGEPEKIDESEHFPAHKLVPEPAPDVPANLLVPKPLTTEEEAELKARLVDPGTLPPEPQHVGPELAEDDGLPHDGPFPMQAPPPPDEANAPYAPENHSPPDTRNPIYFYTRFEPGCQPCNQIEVFRKQHPELRFIACLPPAWWDGYLMKRGERPGLAPGLHWNAIDGTGRIQIGWHGAEAFLDFYQRTRRWQGGKTPAKLSSPGSPDLLSARRHPHPMAPRGANTTIDANTVVEKIFATVAAKKAVLNSDYTIDIPAGMTIETSEDPAANKVSVEFKSQPYPLLHLKIAGVIPKSEEITAVDLNNATADGKQASLTIHFPHLPSYTFPVSKLTPAIQPQPNLPDDGNGRRRRTRARN